MLIAACVTWTRAAAAVNVRVSAMAAKALSCRISIGHTSRIRNNYQADKIF
jgi:hypothetical protein